MKVVFPALLLAAAMHAEPVAAAPPDRTEVSRPKVGLALSGGGARGAAHIGVIRELERLRIPVDYVAGTSLGAIVGGLYAAGLSTDELEEVLVGIDWDDIFRDAPDRRYLSRRRKLDEELFQVDKSFGIDRGRLTGGTGIVQGRKLDLLLGRVTAGVRDIEEFDGLPIPFRAVATDIVTGEEVVLDRGSLATAIRASMSVPGAFTRVDIDGRLLVDGGMANNLPVSVVRRMGADVVIAVDISTPLQTADEINSTIAVLAQLSGFLTRKNTLEQIASLTEDDVLLVPELGDIGSGDFKRALQAVAIGQAAARDATAALTRHALTADEYAQHTAARRGPSAGTPVIAFIRIDNQSSIDERVIRTRIRQRVGEVLDLAQLEQDLGDLYGRGIFETVRYDIERAEDATGLVVSVKEKAWGPRYLQFGANLSSDFGDSEEVGLVIGYTVTPVNRLGGEWRNILRLGGEQGVITEFYQPARADSPYFVLPSLFFINQRFNEIDDDRIVAENRVKRLGVRLVLGRELGPWGRISTGVTRATGDVSTRIGVSDADDDFEDGLVFASFEIDTVDSLDFPTSGFRGLLRWNASRSELGADTEFEQVEADAVGAWSHDRHTLLLGARYFSTFEGEAPLQNQFRLGGLFELPGFTDNELTGANVVLLRSGYQHAWRELVGFPGYLGLSLQLGNVFDDEDDIGLDDSIVAGSAYLGLDTVVGPFYVGYGVAEDEGGALYILLGNRF